MPILVYLSNLGMGGGGTVPPPVVGGDTHDPGPRYHRGWRQRSEHDEDRRTLRERLEALFRSVEAPVAEPPAAMPAVFEVREIRREFETRNTIDWQALLADIQVIERLLELRGQIRRAEARARDEDDAISILLL